MRRLQAAVIVWSGINSIGDENLGTVEEEERDGDEGKSETVRVGIQTDQWIDRMGAGIER